MRDFLLTSLIMTQCIGHNQICGTILGPSFSMSRVFEMHAIVAGVF